MLYVDNPGELDGTMNKREFQRAVIALDGRCMNPQCPNHRARDGRVTGHHVIFKSQGGKNIVEHGITLCSRCHDRAHGKGQKWGDEFMLLILVYWMNKAEWRWDEAWNWLVKRLSLKGRDYDLREIKDDRVALVGGRTKVEPIDK